MTLTPNLIGQRIRSAREERQMTQQDLADHLGKTAAAISELERGKVHQISAIDLYKLADLLRKPIEYFYGEDYSGSDVQDLVALIRIMEPDIRELILPSISSMHEMKLIADQINATDDKAVLLSLAQRLYSVLQPYLEAVTKLSAAGKDAQEKLARLLETESDLTAAQPGPGHHSPQGNPPP
jgi:transcriptional regulator with XRE-family HTH domain